MAKPLFGKSHPFDVTLLGSAPRAGILLIFFVTHDPFFSNSYTASEHEKCKKINEFWSPNNSYSLGHHEPVHIIFDRSSSFCDDPFLANSYSLGHHEPCPKLSLLANSYSLGHHINMYKNHDANPKWLIPILWAAMFG